MNLHDENERGRLPAVAAASPASLPSAEAQASQSPSGPPRRPPTDSVIHRVESESAAVPSHHLSATTHTVELSQLAEINERLAAQSGSSRITAGALGLSSATTAAGRQDLPVPPAAVLTRLCADGPPEYPYIHGHFALPNVADDPGAAHAAGTVLAGPVVAMHSPALIAISRALGLRHQWGT
ncbi:MAG: hypothetical protein WAL50_10435 [Kineosporiaceae bacterium]|jgi:hypothetical protein